VRGYFFWRAKTATASLSMEATYAFLPFGLKATEDALSSAWPSAQAPLLPSSLTHPSVPASWVSTPVFLSRAKIATASLMLDVT
jgi:hypothetical protein